ncbi:MAG: hypothetical protein JWO46_25, partial [Nocardioidaceae bacterium]|nr:hypothetical protein [Nocardioidaceae bacterium]
NVSHTITAGETGKYVRLFAFGNGSGAQNSTCYSPVSPVTPLPTATGKRKVGKKLTANVDPVQAGTAVTYQWLRTKKHRPAHAIAGATGPRYKVKHRDRHRKISVQVTYTRLGYATLVLVSNTKRIR